MDEKDDNLKNKINEMFNQEINQIIELFERDYKNLLLNDLINNELKHIYKKEIKKTNKFIRFDFEKKENIDNLVEKFKKCLPVIKKYNNYKNTYFTEMNKLYKTRKFKNLENLLIDNISIESNNIITKQVIYDYLKKHILLRIKVEEFENYEKNLKKDNKIFISFFNNYNNNELIHIYDNIFKKTQKHILKYSLNSVLDEIEESYKNNNLFNNTISYLKETIMRLS